MLVIVGTARLAEPWKLAEHWADEDACVLTPSDLSKPGWRFRPTRTDVDQIVVDGSVIPETAVRGVVTTLPVVSVDDLPHIVEPDREYVAAEMTAFLLAWLAQLECPVLERPSTSALTGCGRRRWQWIALARALGIETRAPTEADSGRVAEITVVDGRAVDAPNSTVGRAAERLAQVACRSLITLCFAAGRRPTFLAARHVPAVDSPLVADALLTHLSR